MVWTSNRQGSEWRCSAFRQVNARELSQIAGEVTGQSFRPFRAWNLRTLGVLIQVVRRVAPAKQQLCPAWQGMQYMRDMFDGRAKLGPLDNERNPDMRWTTVRDVLAARPRVSGARSRWRSHASEQASPPFRASDRQHLGATRPGAAASSVPPLARLTGKLPGALVNPGALKPRSLRFVVRVRLFQRVVPCYWIQSSGRRSRACRTESPRTGGQTCRGTIDDMVGF